MKQDASFEKTESTCSNTLANIDTYYARNHLHANKHGKDTDMCRSIPYPKQRSQPKAEHLMVRQRISATLGVIIDRTLSYSTHITKVKVKTAARNTVLKKLSNSKWGGNLVTIRTPALALNYSTAEFSI